MERDLIKELCKSFDLSYSLIKEYYKLWQFTRALVLTKKRLITLPFSNQNTLISNTNILTSIFSSKHRTNQHYKLQQMQKLTSMDKCLAVTPIYCLSSFQLTLRFQLLGHNKLSAGRSSTSIVVTSESIQFEIH